jgi:hypothetical protein
VGARVKRVAVHKLLPILLLVTSVYADDLAFFETKIRPILADSCYECHSAKAKKLKGGLRLDHRSHLLTGGDNGPAIVPGKPDESLLIIAVSYKDVDLEMPPKTRLSDAQVADLRKWVELGALWPDEPEPLANSANRDVFDFDTRRAEHWCWQPVQPYKGSIDSFIDAKLAKAGLESAPPADKRTLIRRLSFDLIGLPPSPAEVDAFLADDSPQAYSALVDRLLASPHYGEKWARHWLDLFRYAESYGHEFDYALPHATTYRDYLIRSLNDDIPYDQLIREHIAGDLLPNARKEASIGTAFWWFGEAVHAPTDVRQDEADRVDNQIDVMSKAFLGLTIACARCHDHKFDAISSADYYGMAGFLQSSRRQETILDPDDTIAQAVANIQQEQEAQVLAPAEFANLLMAARCVQRGDYTPPKKPVPARDPVAQPDLVFDDFEDPGFKGWTVTGDAFGTGPSGPIKPQRMSGIHGKLIANSFHGGDRSTGRLLSDPFTISHPYINFLIAGGAHKDKTCINLLIEGIPVLSSTGQNNNHLKPAGWSVADLIDSEAQIEIVDEAKGGWGHVNVDYILFSEQPAAALELKGPKPKIDPAAVAAAAKDRDLDSEQLSALLESLSDVDPTHALHPWATLSALPDAEFAKTHAVYLKKPQEEVSPPFADFANGAEGWTATGHAFGAGPEHGAWNSGRYAPGLYGVLRSPTFTIEHPDIHYAIKTSGQVKIRLIIDGYWMNQYSGLLFGGIEQKVDSKGKWQHVVQRGAISKYKGHRAWIEIHDHGDTTVALRRVHFGPYYREPVNLDHAAIFAKPAANLAEFASRHGEHWAGRPPPFARPSATPVPKPKFALGMTDGSPENEHIFIRGSHKNLGPEVPRRLPLALIPEPPEIKEGSGRLVLAERIADSANPLTTRVLVNRLWHQLFGRGIVPTVDDFGVMGQPPSHPELLDFLAADFAKSGWSIKHSIRKIVHSDTYRRSSSFEPPGATEIDPDNTLLYRAPLRRLQAEAIRDSVLAVSGRLDRKLKPGSVAPYLTPFMGGRGRRGSGPVDGGGRRSIYISIFRNFLPDMLMTFDFPAPFSTMGRRSVSNVPAQALTMMNSPLVAEQAKLWAQRIAKQAGDDDAKIRIMFVEALGRPPSDAQLASARHFLTENAKSADRWQDLAHTLYNMKAFLYLN